MVRTVLRNRPEDTGDLAELLDRTGILAASVPRQRRPEDAAGYAGEQYEQDEFVVPSQGVGRSAVLGWVAGALMLVVAFGGLQGIGQRGEPVNPVGGLAEQMPVSVPETPAPLPSAPAEPPPTTPEPEVAESQPQSVEPEPEPEPEPVVEQPRPEPELISRPEARVDLPERDTEPAPVMELPERLRDAIDIDIEVFDSALTEMSGFSYYP